MYGKELKNLSKKGDKYGFVNEKEIRIAAGIALLFAIVSFFLVMIKGDFYTAFFTVGIIWLDFILKVFIGPEFSIFGKIASLFLKNKEKIWVGAVQKRFAWSIGLILSSFVIFCMLLLSGSIESGNPAILNIIEQINININNNTFFIVPMNPAVLACVLCIIFMFLESVFGICVGCKMYKNLVKIGIMKEYKGQNCINGACEIKK